LPGASVDHVIRRAALRLCDARACERVPGIHQSFLPVS
jgi:hypothetical protein